MTRTRPAPTDREAWARDVLALVAAQERFERRSNRWWRRLLNHARK